VTGGQQHYIEIVHRSLFAEGQDMLDARPWEPRLHDPRGALGENDLVMRRNVIAVRVRNEGEALGVPRVEPQILRGQIETALIPNMDHAKNLQWIDMSETVFARQSDAVLASNLNAAVASRLWNIVSTGESAPVAVALRRAK